MKIGDAFTYEINGRVQIIRKERSFYLAYVEDGMFFCQINEDGFQALKHTVEGKTGNLLQRYMKRDGSSAAEAKERLAWLQRRLRESNLLTKEMVESIPG